MKTKHIDMTGATIKCWLIIRKTETPGISIAAKNGYATWICRCLKCGQEKELIGSTLRNKTPGCSNCIRIKRHVVVERKTCNKCCVSKPTTAYYKYKSSGNPRSICRDCQHAIRVERYKNNPELKEIASVKNSINCKANQKNKYIQSLKKSYGITEDQYNNMLDACGNRCEICKTDSARRLVIDHDHISGKVRGLLCDKCNVAIGGLGDSSESLLAAVDYLCRHEVKSNVLNMVGNVSNV